MKHLVPLAWAAACAAGLALAAAPPRAAPASFDPKPFRTALAQDPEPLGVGRIVPDLDLLDLAGESRKLSALLKDHRAVALCLTSVTCPLSIKYGPRLAKLAAEFQDRGVALVFLNVADTDSLADMRRQARTLGWKWPYLPDRDRALRRALAARTTTEVFLIDAGRTLIYRGAVDDQHGIGSSLDAPRHEFLIDAVESLLAARTPTVRATWPPGCVLAAEPAAAAPAAPITYHNRISRIVQERCLDCHSRERVAPFSLESYDAVVGRAPMIEAVVREGIMPPWNAAPHTGRGPSPWSNDRAMTESERADLIAWLRAGHPVGDIADAPVTKEFPPGWLLGPPDLLLISPSLSVPPDGPMVYDALRVETTLCEDTWISAVELLPRRRDSIHHAVVYAVPPQAAAQPQSGSEPITSDPPAPMLLATYGPGYSTIGYPPGAAFKLPAGWALLVHAYSVPMGTLHKANLRIGLKFAAEPPNIEVRTGAVTAPDLAIPPNDPAFEVVATTQLAEDARITAFMPTMRSRGSAIRYEAQYPEGQEVLLLDIPSYDFKWRVRYELAQPIDLPAGTIIRCRALFDNSSANPSNANPSAEVRAGWTPADDMLLGAFEYLAVPE